jgi:hypothetical protein
MLGINIIVINLKSKASAVDSRLDTVSSSVR